MQKNKQIINKQAASDIIGIKKMKQIQADVQRIKELL